MHRLCRQLTSLNSCSRVLRVQTPPRLRPALASLPRRRYTSSNAPTQLHNKFERLFATLRHGMQEDELAKTIAALVMSTGNKSKVEEIETSVLQFTKEFNRESLYTKVNHYISHPPEDNFDSLITQAPHDPLADSLGNDPQTSSRAYLEHMKDEPLTVEIHEFDPTLPDFFDQLMAHLQTSDVKNALQRLKFEDQEELKYLLSQVMEEFEAEETEALRHIAQFLSYHGVGIQFRCQPKGCQPKDENAEWEEQFRALMAEAPIEDEDLIEGEVVDYGVDEDMPATRNTDRSSEVEADAAPQVEIAELLGTPEDPEEVVESQPFPDLMTPDPLLDARDVLDFPPDEDSPYHNQVIVRNHTSIFNEAAEEDGLDFDSEDYVPTTTDQTEEAAGSRESLPLGPHELNNLYRFPLIRRRITQQTGKGKIHRQFVLMVVGNGDGLVGYGQGKDEDASRAEGKAFAQAVRNMDWVERFEKRTIWTDINTKLGSTQLILRPRPVGFGLRCNPNLHQVLKAAGIKDISAKVWGSRNPINVIKAAFRVLQAGHAPLAMGDGVGGPGRKLNKGSGLRSKSDVERERGRQLISLRK